MFPRMVDDFAATGLRAQSRRWTESKNLKHITVLAVTRRRVGRQPFGFQERVLSEPRPAREAASVNAPSPSPPS